MFSVTSFEYLHPDTPEPNIPLDFLCESLSEWLHPNPAFTCSFATWVGFCHLKPRGLTNAKFSDRLKKIHQPIGKVKAKIKMSFLLKLFYCGTFPSFHIMAVDRFLLIPL